MSTQPSCRKRKPSRPAEVFLEKKGKGWQQTRAIRHNLSNVPCPEGAPCLRPGSAKQARTMKMIFDLGSYPMLYALCAMLFSN